MNFGAAHGLLIERLVQSFEAQRRNASAGRRLDRLAEVEDLLVLARAMQVSEVQWGATLRSGAQSLADAGESSDAGPVKTWLSPAEWAERHGMAVRTVQAHIAARRLPFCELGGKRFIHVDALSEIGFPNA